jgi:hypothetical protein
MTQSIPPNKNQSEIHPLVRIATLEAKVAQIEQRLAKLGVSQNPLAPLLPTANTSRDVNNLFKIVKIETRIIETNNSWSKFAWKLILKSLAEKPLTFNATIEFLDKDGFVVDNSFAYNLFLPAKDEQTYAGYALVNASIAGLVASIQTKVKLS